MKEKKTRLKKAIERIQNHRIAAGMLLLALAVIALANFAGSVEKLWSFRPFREKALQPSPLRFRYVTLEGHALSLLLMGKVDDSLQKALGTTPAVYQNQVYNFLNVLHDKFGYKRQYASYLHGPGIDYASKLGIERIDSLRFCPGTCRVYADYSFDITQSPTELLETGWSLTFVKSPNLRDNDTHLIACLDKGEIDLEQVEFVKFYTRDEALDLLRRIEHPELAYFDWLSRDYWPNDIFMVRAYYDLCGESFHAHVVPLQLKLRVLVAENLSSQSLLISDMTIQVDESQELRKDSLRTSKHVLQNVVSGDLLKTNESVMIPLRLYLTSAPDSHASPDEDDFHSPSSLPVETIRKLSANHSLVSLMHYTETDEGLVSEISSTIRTDMLVSRIQEHEASRNDYMLGPQCEVTEVNVNGRKQAVRAEPPTVVTISHGYEFGSCPHVFAELRNEETRYIGKVLTGRDSQTERGWFYKVLPVGTTAIIVREMELETTHIDTVRFLQGGRIRLWHTDKQQNEETIKYRDGIEYLLRRNDSIRIEIPSVPCMDNKPILLEMFGYYVPDNAANGQYSSQDNSNESENRLVD